MKKFPENFLKAIKDVSETDFGDELNIDYAAAHFNENIEYFLRVPGYIKPKLVMITLDYYRGEKSIDEICKENKFTQVQLDNAIQFVLEKISAKTQIRHLFVGEKLLQCEQDRYRELAKIKETKREFLRQYLAGQNILARTDFDLSTIRMIREFDFADFGLTAGTYRDIISKGIETIVDLLPIDLDHLKQLGFTDYEAVEIFEKSRGFFSV